jgi:hypothetical protein
VEAGRDGTAWVTVDAAISEGLFDIDHQPLKLDGIEVTGPDGAKVAPENVSNGKLRNTFDLKLVKTGTYKIALVSQSVFGSYKDKEGNVKRFRGTEESLAKDVPADATEVKLSRTDSRWRPSSPMATPARKCSSQPARAWNWCRSPIRPNCAPARRRPSASCWTASQPPTRA